MYINFYEDILHMVGIIASIYIYRSMETDKTKDSVIWPKAP